MSKCMVIHPTGMVEVTEFPKEDKLDWYYKKIGCDCIDIVRPFGLELVADTYNLKSMIDRFSLVVDDEGLLKAEPEINVIASLLYGVDDHGQVLCGKVIMVADEVTDDGIDSVGMDDSEIMLAQAAIGSLIDMHNEKVRKARELNE